MINLLPLRGLIPIIIAFPAKGATIRYYVAEGLSIFVNEAMWSKHWLPILLVRFFQVTNIDAFLLIFSTNIN